MNGKYGNTNSHNKAEARGKSDLFEMTTYLRGFFAGANMTTSLKALGYALAKHEGQTRKSGEPYAIHPLWMASYAVALGITDDDTVAVILLHDVCEDCGIDLESLPFDSVVRRGVRYMTISPFDDEPKLVTKVRYFNELLECREALLCKAIDRFSNLSTAEGVLSEESVVKNVKETYDLLLPVLKKGKDKWPEYSNLFFVLRANLKAVCRNLAISHAVEPYISDFGFTVKNEEEKIEKVDGGEELKS